VDDLANNGGEITLTRDGKPVAKLVRVESATDALTSDSPRPDGKVLYKGRWMSAARAERERSMEHLRGTVKIHGDIVSPIYANDGPLAGSILYEGDIVSLSMRSGKPISDRPRYAHVDLVDRQTAQADSSCDRSAQNTDRLAIASITLWEIAMLVEKKRITLERDVLDWLQDAIDDTGAEVLPLTPQIAVAATTFPELRDPSDRLIAATALTHGVPLVTKDERIQRSGVVATIW